MADEHTLAEQKGHTMMHTYIYIHPQPMFLPSVNLLHLMESKKYPRQDFETHGHYDLIVFEI